jgi:uncharacterized protein YneF (UPF0154 family)
MSGAALSIVLAMLLGIVIGWLVAHHTIATECQKLGAFYVGRTVFECKVRPAPTTAEG